MPVTVLALPRNSNIHVHTCALKTVLHTMCGDKAASAWVAYVKPFVGSADGKEAAVQSEIAALCDEYADVFEQPGLPVHDVDLPISKPLWGCHPVCLQENEQVENVCRF